jgi:hypothetical protein
MPRRSTASYAPERQIKRDLELCKVVFGAAVSRRRDVVQCASARLTHQ